jgi:succinate dehydrogenase / fumarate reductase cytochrome b subunit
MNRLRLFYRGTLGKKAAAAVTGIVLFGWITLHMAGNLKVFAGFDEHGEAAMDHYAEFLRTMGTPILPQSGALWLSRVVLLAAVALHIHAVMALARRNRAARPVAYEGGLPASSYAARSMVATGVLIAGFVVFHILHLTTGTIVIGSFEHGRVYGNLAASFRNGFAAFLYAGVTVVLGTHLYHGVWSLFQTLGIDNPDRNRMLRAFATGAAVLIAGGFLLVPILFFLGALPGGPKVGS